MRNALAACILVLLAACIPASVVRIASHFQDATPAPWVSLRLSVDGPVEDAGKLLTEKAAAVALSYQCAVPAPGDVQLLFKEVKTKGQGREQAEKTVLKGGFYCLKPGAPPPLQPLTRQEGGGHA